MEIKVRIKFTKRLYGTPDGDFSVFAAIPFDSKEKKKVSLNKYGNFTISGDYALDDNELGKPFTVTIVEDRGARYPNSYKMKQLHYEFPKTAREQWEYLDNSDIMPGLTLLNVAQTFKPSDKIIDIIVKDPEALTKVKGIGEARAETYRNRLINDKGKALVFAKYGKIDGIGPLVIKRILHWKPSVETALEIIEDDPFSLLEIEGIGFVTADIIRDYHKIPLNDYNRILHGVKHYVTDQFQNTGDTYENIEVATSYAAEKLLVSQREVVNALLAAKDDEVAMDKFKLKLIGKNITTIDLFEAEQLIYKDLAHMVEDKRDLIPNDKWIEAKDEYLKGMSVKLSEEQESFLDIINKERVSILLGPGGAGKSWVTKIAVDLFESFGKKVGLFAPTARAAHVMKDYVERDASTIHRGLMGLAMSGEAADYDVLIVDEFSMVDSELAAMVVKVMRSNARLIIIGDSFQLPSVGPGNVLHDLTHYMSVPTIKLTKIYRQAEGSGILDYADDLRNHNFYLTPGAPRLDNGDIVFINEPDHSRQKDMAMAYYNKAKSKLNADVMLLSPVNGGDSGRRTLNRLVQEQVNPGGSKAEMVFGQNLDEDQQVIYREGDYITVKKNQYEMETDFGEIKEIINGDLGYVKKVAGSKLTFEIEDETYTVDKSEVRDLIDHAWSITIHRAQGGQADEVIIVLPRNSYFMLNANMLYTAITRAKKKCYIIGDFSKMNQSSKRMANFRRKTMIQLQHDITKGKGGH